MKKLILTIILFKSFCIFGAEIYFSLHYNNLGGNPLYQGMKNEGQSINICMFDNGTTSDCVNNYPTIVNKFSDNSTNNSPLDNDTRFFEEKLNPKIGTTKVSFGIGINFLAGSYLGIGTRYGITLGIARIQDIKNKTVFEGTGPLYGFEFETFTLHDKLSFFNFFPLYRVSYHITDIIPLYILGQNKSGMYHRRMSAKMTSLSHQYGGSFRIPIQMGFASRKKKKGGNPTTGLFFDFYRDITEANLTIEKNHKLKIKSYNSGFSIKFSAPL